MVTAPTDVQPAQQPAERIPARTRVLHVAGLLAAPAAAVVLWASAMRGVAIGAMNDFGLASVLPAQTWLAFAVLTAGFILCWHRADRSSWPLALHVLLLIVMLYGMPAIVAHGPIGPIVFRHAGITESLARTGVVNTKVDAYFSWPGFFMGLATLVKLSGLRSALSYGAWAPVAFNVLYLPPLLLLTRALTRDRRLVWGAIWVFYVANWINQDYLAPQAFGYLLYLTILGLLLTYLRPHGTDFESPWRFGRWISAKLGVRPADVPGPVTSRRTAQAVVVLIVVLYAAAVASHQLTPFAILLSVTALVALGQCTARGLPLLMALMVVVWVIFVAQGYLSGHISQLVGLAGDITKATSANVTSRLSGSQDHLAVVKVRLALSAGLWLLALLGGIRRFRAGRADHVAAVLGLVPILLFATDPYGGEMLMRIYFFMLPFGAFFATAAVLPSAAAPARQQPVPSGDSGPLPAGLGLLRASPSAWMRACVAPATFGVIAAVLLGACTVARYGNDRLDYFPPAELTAMRVLYRLAEPGSTLAVERPYLPWKFQAYEQHKYVSIVNLLSQQHHPSPAQALGQIAKDLLAVPEHPAGYLVLTRSQHVYAEMLGGAPTWSYLSKFERLLRRSDEFALVYSNRDAQIYLRLPEHSHAHPMFVARNRRHLHVRRRGGRGYRSGFPVASGIRPVVPAYLSRSEPGQSFRPARAHS